jgi:hypothetical protein
MTPTRNNVARHNNDHKHFYNSPAHEHHASFYSYNAKTTYDRPTFYHKKAHNSHQIQAPNNAHDSFTSHIKAQFINSNDSDCDMVNRSPIVDKELLAEIKALVF